MRLRTWLSQLRLQWKKFENFEWQHLFFFSCDNSLIHKIINDIVMIHVRGKSPAQKDHCKGWMIAPDRRNKKNLNLQFSICSLSQTIMHCMNETLTTVPNATSQKALQVLYHLSVMRVFDLISDNSRTRKPFQWGGEMVVVKTRQNYEIWSYHQRTVAALIVYMLQYVKEHHLTSIQYQLRYFGVAILELCISTTLMHTGYLKCGTYSYLWK